MRAKQVLSVVKDPIVVQKQERRAVATLEQLFQLIFLQKMLPTDHNFEKIARSMAQRTLVRIVISTSGSKVSGSLLSDGPG